MICICITFKIHIGKDYKRTRIFCPNINKGEAKSILVPSNQGLKIRPKLTKILNFSQFWPVSDNFQLTSVFEYFVTFLWLTSIYVQCFQAFSGLIKINDLIYVIFV